MEHIIGYIQFALTLIGLVIVIPALKGKDKPLATIFAISGLVMLVHISIELLGLSELIYSVTGLMYTVSIIFIVLILGKKEVDTKQA